MAVDSAYVYFRLGQNIQTVTWIDKLGENPQLNRIYTNPKNEGNTDGIEARAVALSECGVVWATGTDIFVTRFQAADAIRLAHGTISRILVEGDTVYWTDLNGAIGRRLLPP